MQKKTNKVITTLLSVIIAVSGTVSTMPAPIYAATVEPMKKEFVLLDQKTGSPVALGKDSQIKVYSDSLHTQELEGVANTDGNHVVFTPSEVLDDATEFYYAIKVDGYNWAYGGTFNFTEGDDIDVAIKKISPEHLTFKYKETELNADNIVLRKDGKVITVSTDENSFDLSDYSVGDVIDYEAVISGFFSVTGSVKLINGDMEETITLTEKTRLDMEAPTINKAYGDGEFNLADSVVAPDGYEGGFIFEIKEGSDVISLDNGIVTIVKSGTAVITAISEETKEHVATETDIKITVAKKNLGTLTADNFTWTGTEKDYNGTIEFFVEGTYTGAGLVGNDKLSVIAELESPSSNVGNYNSIVANAEFIGDSNYTCSLDDETTIPVTINTKVLTVSLKGISVNYGSEEWKNICNGNIPDEIKLQDILSFEDDLTDGEKEEISSLILSSIFSVSVNKKKYKVGTTEEALTLSIVTSEAGNFKFSGGKLTANITVEQEEASDDAWNNIEIDEGASNYVHIEDSIAYVRPGGNVALKVKDNTLYDTVNVKKKDSSEYSLSFPIGETEKSGNVEGTYYLSDSTSPATMWKNEKSIPAGTIIVDADYPEVIFEDGTGNYSHSRMGETPELQEFVFDHIVQGEGYIIKPVVTDTLSGVDKVSYTVISVSDEESLEQTVKEASTEETTDWKTFPTNGEITVSGTKTGYYVVLVRVSDHVGNEAVYASNGTVVDVTAPTLTIEGILSDKYYSEDVDYTLRIGDPVDVNGVHTGIDRVEVTVKSNGQKINGENGVDSFVITGKEIYGAGDNTFAVFDARSRETEVSGIITASKCDSNNIEISVAVYDQAGNSYETSKKLMIDLGVADVTASYDNNDVRNEKYFNADRSMTLSVKKRNFDEESLFLAITVNGVSGIYTVEQIRSGAVAGVYLASDRVDSEKEKTKESYTDTRTNTYVISFGGNGKKVDYDYAVDATYKDSSGKDVPAEFEASEAAKSFTVDEIAPVLTMNYKDSKGADVPVGTEKDNPFYDINTMTVQVSVNERNFRNTETEVVVISKDAEGNDIGAYSQDDADEIKTDVWVEGDDDAHIYTLKPFENDANFAISGSYTDLAGNEAENYEFHYFTVDKTAPDGKIYVIGNNGEKKEYSRKENSEGGLLEYIFNFFDNKKVTIENEANDLTSGLKSVKYCLVDVDGKSESHFGINTDFDSLDWEDWDEELKVDADRIAVIYARLEDKAGHITYLSSDGGFIVDTRNANKPEITVSEAVKYHKNDFVITVAAEDPDFGGDGIYAGMKSISYQLIDNNTGKTSEITELIAADVPRIKRLSGDITVSAKEWNTNSLTLRVTVLDYANNVIINEEDYIIDATAPTIDAIVDTSDAKNGKYYNETKNIHVVFTERNFDPDKATMRVTVDGTEKVFNFKQLTDKEAEPFGLSLITGTDTQQNTKESSRMDDRTISYTILLGKDAKVDRNYQNISFTCIDEAGNSGKTVISEEFVIDKISPVMTIRYTSGEKDITKYVTTNADIPYYGSKDIIATITVNEKHFDETGLTLSLSQKNNAGEDVSTYKGSLTPRGWANNGNSHTIEMGAFIGDAIYGLSASFADLAGNKAAVYEEHYFCVDKTVPEGKLILNAKTGTVESQGFRENQKFTVIENSSVGVSLKTYDATSGIAAISYSKYIPPVNTSGEFRALTKAQLRETKWKAWDESLSVNPDSQAVLYTRIADRAGNITYISSNGGVIVDRTDPARPTISISGMTAGKVYSKNVSVKFSAEDVVNGGTYAGLRTVTAQVIKDGKVTQEESYSFNPKGNRVRTYDGSITVNAKKNNSNNVVIRVTVVDYAGNLSSSEKKISIDITAPRIEVTYDNNSPANGKYFNDVRTATIRIYERNFDSSLVNFDITGENVSISNWNIENKSSDDSVNICTITYSTDTEYTFTMTASDKAGNKASYGQTDTFVIDRTKPVISVSFDNNAGNGKYFNAARTATITVTDRNFDATSFTASITASLRGRGITAPAVSAWSGNGDIHSAMIHFASDGDYAFVLNAKDLAGNIAKTFMQPEFTIDLTAPEINFSGVEDKSANRGEIAPSIFFIDTNINKDSIVITLEGLKHEKRTIEGEFSAVDGGWKVALKDFARTQDEDDIYTLTAITTDVAGNMSSQFITFSVNRYGSNFYLDDASKKYVDDRYHKEGESIVVYEVNVDELKTNGVTINHTGKSTKLQTNQYTVENISEDGDWKKYKYTISKECFVEEGMYEIVIDSIDAAGNRQDNKLKNSSIDFVVDRTTPGVVITGVEDGGVYNNLARVVSFNVSDDQAIDSLYIYLDGEVVDRFDAKQLYELEGKVDFGLKEAGKWQIVSAKAVDAAGNESEEDTVKILVTTNSFIRAFSKPAVRYGTSGGLLAVIGGIIAVIAKKKKNKEGTAGSTRTEKTKK